VTLVLKNGGRTISGRVIGSASAHVIAGHFHDGTADLYSVPVSARHRPHESMTASGA